MVIGAVAIRYVKYDFPLVLILTVFLSCIFTNILPH